jgi:hypothetical protein
MSINKNSARGAGEMVAEVPISTDKEKAPIGARKSSKRSSNPEVSKLPKTQKKKPKLVRDSFTMPQADFDLIALIKARMLNQKRPAKKSELLRAGLFALNALNDRELVKALNRLVPLTPGRPKKVS